MGNSSSKCKSVHCPLCFHPFATPRILPCLHTFCEKCLGSHIETQVQSTTIFMCPLCAAPTVPADSKLAVEKWASAFPIDTFIYELLESPVLQEKSNNCEPCETDGKTEKAQFWCKDCCEKMCGSCNKLHKRNKQLKYHAIVPIAEIDQHEQPNFQFDQECCLHRYHVTLFCVDHRELCCAVCVDTNHDKCNDVRTIDDIASDQSLQSNFDYSSIIMDTSKLKQEMEKIMTEKKIIAKQVLKEKDQAIHDMDVRVDSIIKRLNRARNIFKNDTEGLYKDTERSILESEKKVQSFVTNVHNFGHILEIMEKSGTPRQQFTTFENFRRQISSHYCQLKLHLKDDTEVHFAANHSKVLNDLERTLDPLGTVEISKNSSKATHDVLLHTDEILKNLDSRTKVSTQICAAQVEKQDLMKSPVTFVKAVSRQKLGSRTWFSGGTYTADGRLIMADSNNSRLVELDDEYNVVKQHKIDGKPSDVAAGNKDNKIYIVVNYKCMIYKCTLHTDLKIVNRIKAPSGTWGIAVSGDKIIVGTTNTVVILTQDGSTVRSIPISGGFSYVAVSKTQRTIYHIDNEDLVCRTWEGQELFRYRHQQLKYPCGIDIDSDRNVYICGNDSRNLYQVSRDGHKNRIIQLNNISVLWNVVVHPQKKELVVTSWNEDTVCEIYRFG